MSVNLRVIILSGEGEKKHNNNENRVFCLFFFCFSIDNWHKIDSYVEKWWCRQKLQWVLQLDLYIIATYCWKASVFLQKSSFLDCYQQIKFSTKSSFIIHRPWSHPKRSDPKRLNIAWFDIHYTANNSLA